MQPEKAAERYNRAVEIQPNHPQAHCNLGVIHKNAGRLEEAIASYRAALAAAPDFQVVAANLAIALVEKAAAVKAAGSLDACTPSCRLLLPISLSGGPARHPAEIEAPCPRSASRQYIEDKQARGVSLISGSVILLLSKQWHTKDWQVLVASLVS